MSTTALRARSFDDITEDQLESFHRDGFLIVEEGLLSGATIELLRERFAALFEGEYATGIGPDEVNWRKGRDPEDRTRQICNGWRADDLIAAQVLSETTGRIAARLGGYTGTRMLQDNCLWKPPGAKSLGMHQDGSFADYLVPAEMITCWVALDDTQAGAGTIEYVRGSHRWPKMPPDRGSFHAPDDWLAPMEAARPADVEAERVPVVVKAGGCAFHHSLTFHGSGAERGDGRAPRSGLPSRARAHALPPAQHGRDLLALPPPWRPRAGRVVLPRGLGRERRAQRLARDATRAAVARPRAAARAAWPRSARACASRFSAMRIEAASIRRPSSETAPLPSAAASRIAADDPASALDQPRRGREHLVGQLHLGGVDRPLALVAEHGRAARRREVARRDR